MKKTIVLFTLFMAITCVSQSCKKCLTCTKVNGTDETREFCEEDFMSKEAYQEAIQVLRNNGSKCN